MQRFIWTFLAVASLATGCATATKGDLIATVKRKASFELGCAAEELKVSELSNQQNSTNGFGAVSQNSYGVQGCGKRASYRAYCSNIVGSENCDAMQTSQPTTVK